MPEDLQAADRLKPLITSGCRLAPLLLEAVEHAVRDNRPSTRYWGLLPKYFMAASVRDRTWSFS
jgi:hypothetical protein